MSARTMPVWLHDDTEEDLVGADWHQEAIGGTVDGLRDEAETSDLPWHVGNQLALLAWRPDGTEWRPVPDIMVHPDAGPERRNEMRASVDGVPSLVIEVLSETTWRYDRDTSRGKAFGYMRLGVPEILLFDPTDEYLGQGCMGWRQEGDEYQAWEPDANDRFHSPILGVSFASEGMLLRVYDRSGRPIPFRSERTRTLAERDAEIARLRAQLDQYSGRK
ncbi:MAG TPA: Uma2 family endonuclease [Chloroflexota bacterium]